MPALLRAGPDLKEIDVKNRAGSVSRRRFLGLVGAGAVGAAIPRAVRSAKPQAGKPNFIIIYADDQGYQDVGCFGSPKIKTPNLDRMAKEGMRFTDFYSVASVCTPSRAGLMTGCYAQRVGLPSVLFPRSNTGLSAKEVTIPEILKSAGYATACVGKWHLGHHKPFLPTRHGFDSYFGIPYSNDMTVDVKMDVADDAKFLEGMTLDRMRNDKPKKNWVPLLRDEKIVEYPCDQTTLTERYTAEAIRFITANKGGPFFLYLPHTFPHVPLFSSTFKGKSARGPYGDVIEAMDWSTGEIIKTLQKLGIDENTLVVYTSDNGPWLSKGKAGGCALPLRDGKFSTYEGGMREPCIMRWPGKIPAGKVCSEVAATIDMLPTLSKLAGAGAKIPTDRVIDGKDIWPLMSGQPGATSPHEAFFYLRGGGVQAVRVGKWKLRKGGGGRKKKDAKSAPGGFVLYDLHADISEKTNVASKNPDIVKKLATAMTKFEQHLKQTSRPPGKVSG